VARSLTEVSQERGSQWKLGPRREQNTPASRRLFRGFSQLPGLGVIGIFAARLARFNLSADEASIYPASFSHSCENRLHSDKSPDDLARHWCAAARYFSASPRVIGLHSDSSLVSRRLVRMAFSTFREQMFAGIGCCATICLNVHKAKVGTDNIAITMA